MAVTSTMLPLGTPAPDFRLTDAITGRMVALEEYRDAPALLVMFICNHCPFVRHVRPELARIGREYQQRGVAVVAINSNDPERYPQDAPPGMREESETAGYTFPYLFDEEQEVARAFSAACTPDFYLFDGSQRLVYRGQLDPSRPGNQIPVTGEDLRNALDAVLDGRPIEERQTPSIGCNIKWKPGREPIYFG
jgi:peroxiredoxin